MEFIVTGLFIIFFSYILLYSLYDFLFKRSIIEGVVVNGDKKDDNEDDEQAKAKQKEKDEQAAGSKVEDMNNSTKNQSEDRPNMTLAAGTAGVDHPNFPS